MADEPVSIVVAESDAGKRLDAALAGLLPGMGLRGRRRACELGRAQVNGRARPAAYRTRPGDVLTLAARQEGGDGAFLSRAVAPVLTPEKAEAGGLAALFKPAGMHCAALAGKPGICLGDLLAGLPGSARLLNRLDCATSGIVMAALDAEGERRWKEAQDGGLTRKHYLALLQGRLDGGRMVKQRLILKGRERVLVENGIEPLYYPYYEFVKEHPITRWGHKTHILRGEGDTLCAYATVKGFAERFGCELCVQPGGEHWFHTDSQLAFFRDWIAERL